MSRFEHRVRRLLNESEEYRLGFEEGAFELELAHALEAARARSGLSKAALAERMGLKRPFVSRKLNHPDNMEIDTLSRFLHSLDMRADIVIREARPRVPTLRVLTSSKVGTRSAADTTRRAAHPRRKPAAS